MAVTRLAVLLVCFLCLPRALGAERPKLVVLIIVDGLPQEQLARAWDRFPEGGFRRLAGEGAWFRNAEYSYATTFTAVGHATLATGALPPQHGLIANDWMDRTTGERVYCVEDAAHHVLGEQASPHSGTSPRNLRSSTLADQLRRATGGRSRALSVSIKDRGAILPLGTRGSAYWYSSKTGRFVTSTFYAKDYPKWWREFHEDKPQNRWFDKQWETLFDPTSDPYSHSVRDGQPWQLNYKGLGTRFPFKLRLGLANPNADYYSRLTRTPFGDQYTLDFLKAGVEAEGLGRNHSAGVADFLSVSFSSHDYINHLFGPESIQSSDHLLRLDRMLADLFKFLDRVVGRDRYMAALTSDHGFGACPEYAASVGLPAGSLDTDRMLKELNRRLADRYGSGDWVLAWWNPTFYLNSDLIRSKGLKSSEVEDAAAEWVRKQAGVEAVYTRTELEGPIRGDDPLFVRASRSWSRELSGDLLMIGRPYWYVPSEGDKLAATHGGPYPYDARVPLVFWGPGVRPGFYDQPADVLDLAPTLAALLGITPPEHSRGRVLHECMAERPSTN